ncbi:unnamed protein product [Didymodactylos carnosus]|uniref:LamG domain-containing protein n=1 Tax=Didymodactylos carnosus TaxID=1234261 RepID=A0A814QS44_9BILA|nr:unnamed protein product [Didymodactylos carnosus]CAF3885615.1 unnamed protein product [Didymodactylos carnosus]
MFPTNVRTITQKSTTNLTKKSKRSFKCKRPEWLTKKVLIVGGITTGVLIIAAIVIPIAVKAGSPSTAATTTTTTAAPVVLAYWALQNNANDFYGNYSGTTNCNWCYFTTTGFFYGYMFYMYSTNSYISVPSTSYFNLNSRSFTFQIWINLNSLSIGDQPIFSQCTCTTCSNQCLFLIIRSSKLYMGFTYNDLAGSTTLVTGVWYHVAFVYNYQTLQQIIYLDGVQDAISSNAQPYLGTNGTMYFGYSTLLPSNYFNAYIYMAQLTTRAKSATEMLNAGTQIYYFSFDQPSPYYDNGPNLLNYTGVSGLASTSGKPKTENLFCRSKETLPWVYPSSINGGVLVYSSNGINILGLTYSGQIVGQIYEYQPVTVYQAVVGPFLSTSTWTHVAWTFSLTNGMILYVNGAVQGSITGVTSYYFGSHTVTIMLGYGNGATYGYIPGYGFQGILDEFYAYRRELTASEVLTLASV